MQTITESLTFTLSNAAFKQNAVFVRWLQASATASKIAGNSGAALAFQRAGKIDMLLRCVEEERQNPPMLKAQMQLLASDMQIMLSEVWLMAAYEPLRQLVKCELKPPGFTELFTEIEAVRVPIAKNHIAGELALKGPIPMTRVPPFGDPLRDEYAYDPKNNKRSHSMPLNMSDRGSIVWEAIIVNKGKQNHAS